MSFTFTAIDFETANHSGNSICQIGLVRVTNGQVTQKLDLLVKPPENKYHSIHTGIHGLTASHTRLSPTFNRIWPDIAPFIENQNVVAHNISFDARVLLNTLAHYRISPPAFKQHCTLKIYGAKLNVLCRQHNIALNHHSAISDAMACASLFLIHLNGN